MSFFTGTTPAFILSELIISRGNIIIFIEEHLVMLGDAGKTRIIELCKFTSTEVTYEAEKMIKK